MGYIKCRDVVTYLSGQEEMLLLSFPFLRFELKSFLIQPSLYRYIRVTRAMDTKIRRTEMRRSIFVSERRKDLVYGTLANIHQHVCVGKTLHGSDLVALSCRW